MNSHPCPQQFCLEKHNRLFYNCHQVTFFFFFNLELIGLYDVNFFFFYALKFIALN